MLKKLHTEREETSKYLFTYALHLLHLCRSKSSPTNKAHWKEVSLLHEAVPIPRAQGFWLFINRLCLLFQHSSPGPLTASRIPFILPVQHDLVHLCWMDTLTEYEMGESDHGRWDAHHVLAHSHPARCFPASQRDVQKLRKGSCPGRESFPGSRRKDGLVMRLRRAMFACTLCPDACT